VRQLGLEQRLWAVQDPVSVGFQRRLVDVGRVCVWAADRLVADAVLAVRRTGSKGDWAFLWGPHEAVAALVRVAPVRQQLVGSPMRLGAFADVRRSRVHGKAAGGLPSR